MKIISKITLSLAVATTILLTGCNDTTVAKTQVAKASITEASLGLRKTDLYSENTTAAAQTNYGKNQPMSGYKIKRAFQDAPPMIPHDTEGMLPIKINNNQCLGCHMPDVASGVGATAIPVSHFTNFRPTHKFDGKKFEKSIDNMKNEIAISKASSKLTGARFNCSQCHAPQSQGNLAVENTFEADFTSKDGASKSSWNGDRMTYKLDTLGKDSAITIFT
jgi:cytochrome c-type protein NapB